MTYKQKLAVYEQWTFITTSSVRRFNVYISPMENARNTSPQRIEKATIINLEKGKLPPQVLDLEEAVLGAMMIDKKGVDDVIDIFRTYNRWKAANPVSQFDR